MKRSTSLFTLAALFMVAVVSGPDSAEGRWVNVPGVDGRWDDPATWLFGEVPSGSSPHTIAPLASTVPDGAGTYDDLVKLDDSGRILIDSANVGSNAAVARGIQGVGWGVNPDPPNFAAGPPGSVVLEITGGQLDIRNTDNSPNGNGNFMGWRANGTILMSGGEINVGPFGVRQNTTRNNYSGFTLDMSGGVINATAFTLPLGPDGDGVGGTGPGVSINLSGDAHLNSSGGVLIGGIDALGNPLFGDCGGTDDCSPNIVMSDSAKITAPEPDPSVDLFQKLEFDAAIARGDVVAAPGFSLVVTHDPASNITTLMSIPEPTTIALFGLVALLLLGGRRKR